MSLDRAVGTLLGLCIGDAAGAVLEIPLKDSCDEELVERALSFPGGGAHRLGPGQITDEAEMALALAHGLTEQPPPGFPADDVASFYAQWLDSKPFTVGKHCREPVAAAVRSIVAIKGSPAKCMSTTASKKNSWTQASGALSRVAPIAIWSHNWGDEIVGFCAEEDARLTHPHENCMAANAIFAVALAYLIRQPGDVDLAIHASQEYASANAPAEVSEWLSEALDPRFCPSVTQAGSSDWVRWPFTYAFRHLKLRSSYETAMRDILGRGGATAANAAIVGAMIGALHGAAAIPASLKDPILLRSVGSPGHPKYSRPNWLHTDIVPRLSELLLNGPSEISSNLTTPDKMSSR